MCRYGKGRCKWKNLIKNHEFHVFLLIGHYDLVIDIWRIYKCSKYIFIFQNWPMKLYIFFASTHIVTWIIQTIQNVSKSNQVSIVDWVFMLWFPSGLFGVPWKCNGKLSTGLIKKAFYLVKKKYISESESPLWQMSTMNIFEYWFRKC